jgi:hypothetical protein
MPGPVSRDQGPVKNCRDRAWRGDFAPARDERLSGSSAAGVRRRDSDDDASNEKVELMSEPSATD